MHCVCVCVLVVIAVAAAACYLVPHEHLNAVEQFGSFSASKFSLEINNACLLSLSLFSSLSRFLSVATARQPFLTALIDVAMAAIIGHRGARVCVRELKNFYCIHLSSQHNFSLFATQSCA